MRHYVVDDTYEKGGYPFNFREVLIVKKRRAHV